MATYIKDLKEDNGDITRPVTEAGAVLLSGGGDLETTLASKASQASVDAKISIGGVLGTDLTANAKTTILNMIYPVGSIFMSTALTTAAAVGSALGGTWEAWGGGRVPVGMGSNGTTTYSTVEATGGEETHTLTVAEMPSHTHTQNPHGHRARYAVNMAAGSGNHGPNSTGNNWKAANTWIENTTATNQNTGGGGAHNNMQPYVTVYMYKRTA